MTGFSGEQFALPEAIPLLRAARKSSGNDEIRISDCDPLNLAGILTPGPRFAAGRNRWLLYVDGMPVAGLDARRRIEVDGTDRRAAATP